MALTQRTLLLRLTKYLFGIIALVSLLVLVDYSIDLRPRNVQQNYYFSLKTNDITYDSPTWLRQDNLQILLIKRSKDLLNHLSQAREALQDPDSNASRQPAYAKNSLRSKDELYFVSYAIGTDLACPLTLEENQTLKETCSLARYDFAGRAFSGNNQFHNLTIPEYNFNDDFSRLTISIY
jgi:hypothetical protein